MGHALLSKFSIPFIIVLRYFLPIFTTLVPLVIIQQFYKLTSTRDKIGRIFNQFLWTERFSTLSSLTSKTITADNNLKTIYRITNGSKSSIDFGAYFEYFRIILSRLFVSFGFYNYDISFHLLTPNWCTWGPASASSLVIFTR